MAFADSGKGGAGPALLLGSAEPQVVTSAISVLVLTFNERENIARTLSRLSWAHEIVVLDSFSDDGTPQIAAEFPNVRIVQRRFDDHTSQWNFGVDAVSSEWVLTLDADYVLSDELITELRNFNTSDASAYFANFVYCVGGTPLRGTLYPPRAVLFQRRKCRYIPDGHTQLLKIDGNTRRLRGIIFHDDRKPLNRWLDSQRKYALLEAQHLLQANAKALSRVDRLRRSTYLAPFFITVYTLLWKRLLFDGQPGWLYCMQRAYAELLLALFLRDQK